MNRKRRAIKADHGLDHMLGASRQLEYRVGDASPRTEKIGIRPLSREIPRAAPMAEMTPEDEPAPLHGSDVHEPAEISPDENGIVVN